MQKIVLVKSYFIQMIEEVTREVPTGVSRKGFFGKEKPEFRNETQLEEVGTSDSMVDSERLAVDLAAAVQNLNDEGYTVKSITPIVSGDYSFDFKSDSVKSSSRILRETEKVYGGASYGFGYGYSYTDSLIVLAEKSD